MKKTKIDVRKILMIAIVLLVVFSIYAFSTIQQIIPVDVSQLSSISELSTDGYMLVENVDANVVENAGSVVLTGGCYQVTANTEAVQAEAIKRGIEGTVGPRPLTHDLMRDLFENLGIEIVMLKIVDVRDSTFIGSLIVKQGNTLLSLDSRPSDGIALVVRTESPIYFKETLMKEFGEYIC